MRSGGWGDWISRGSVLDGTRDECGQGGVGYQGKGKRD